MKNWITQAIQLLGAISFSICLISIVGYYTGTQYLYSWSAVPTTEMSLPNAVAIGANGLGLFFVGLCLNKL